MDAPRLTGAVGGREKSRDAMKPNRLAAETRRGCREQCVWRESSEVTRQYFSFYCRKALKARKANFGCDEHVPFFSSRLSPFSLSILASRQDVDVQFIPLLDFSAH